MKAKAHTLIGLMLVLLQEAGAQPQLRWEDRLTVAFAGRHGQVEVGGPYAGMEFHDGVPLPSRISFYYPVANSIDLSRDYWKRNESRPVVVGIQVDSGPRVLLGTTAWEYSLSPHRVRFHNRTGDLRVSLTYDFCLNQPAAVMSLTVRNAGGRPHGVELYTHTAIVLRSCQSYARFASAITRMAEDAIVASFDDVPVGRASVAVQNVGLSPHSWTSSAAEVAMSDTGGSGWLTSTGPLRGTMARAGDSLQPVAAFAYHSRLAPGDSMTVVQVIGSAREEEIDRLLQTLRTSWRYEIGAYDSLVRASTGHGVFTSNDSWVDNSVSFAKALLTSNRHFLDGSIVPMPCPAEYNFFFTHDALLTDLSAINYDPSRVKADLLFLVGHARDSVLPHAYYWKDDAFVTEYCAAGNWNHLWFIQATASYLRHTLDTATVVRLLPVMNRSLELSLSRRRGNVMVGKEPDWWDFGDAEGARAYLTILTARALEDYVYVGAMVGADAASLRTYEGAARDLREGLRDELWDEKAGYLHNRIGDRVDRHTYMGPLLAAAYRLLPRAQAQRLLQTARRELLDPQVGLRTVAPADFHSDSVKMLYHVKENEAGGPYLYANGGVWYLGNAWYAWALRETEGCDSAYAFYRACMTVDGITRSPRGQPALYEYRFADRNATDYGWVDKPTMMWSAGFCIGTAYRLLGFDEEVWNLSVGGAIPSRLDRVEAEYFFGSPQRFFGRGAGATVARISVDGKTLPSRVLPLEARRARSIDVRRGPVRFPYLESVNAILHTADIDTAGGILTLALSSFPGHRAEAVVVSRQSPAVADVNGRPAIVTRISGEQEAYARYLVSFQSIAKIDTLTIRFERQ